MIPQKAKPIVAYLLLVAALAFNFVRVQQTQSQLQAAVSRDDHQRVVTVTQRCDLTNLLAKALPPKNAAALHASYLGCEQQLVIVKKIAAGSK
jgi:hypothetical protein